MRLIRSLFFGGLAMLAAVMFLSAPARAIDYEPDLNVTLEWSQIAISSIEVLGRVTVIRNVDGDPRPPDWPTWEPWPDNSRREIYELDAVVRGVSTKLIDGEIVLASDLELTCSHKMGLVEVDGAPVAPAPVEFDTGLLDTLSIDGKPVTIVRDISVPAAGTPVAHKYVVRG